MPTLNLKNITIKKLQDKNFNDYFLIVNNDNQDEAYFCFEWTIKEGWTDLMNNWENIKEVEIEFETFFGGLVSNFLGIFLEKTV